MTYFYGGTISKLVRLGFEIKVTTITQGTQSTLNPNYSEEDIKNILLKEHSEALKILGVKDFVVFDEFINHFIYESKMQLKLREKLIKEIRKFKPQTIISFDISNIFDENPDHKLLSKIVLESASFSAYPLIHKEHHNEALKPHFVSRVLMNPTTLPNLYLNIDKIDLNNKIKAGFAYKSQLELMYDEFKHRLNDYEIDIPFKNIPIEELWPMICESDAKSCAEKAKKFYKENPHINPYSEQELNRFEYAEEFRVVFLGVLEKIKNILPKELYKIF